jgi:uncharacterized repeat protein (TIGR03803 family)
LAPAGGGFRAPERSGRFGREHRSAENRLRMAGAGEFLPSLAAFALLASTILAPAHAAGEPAWSERVVYSFQGAAAGDGAYPEAALINVAGTLYGTTWQGGADGYGTVFKVTTSGTETALYSFQGPVANDGAFPLAGLIDVGNMLYGTTRGGGAHQYGTVFRVTPAGVEKVLYSFSNVGNDGAFPEAGLLNVNGTLYGTTADGGLDNAGTVFKVTRNGVETPLHGFSSNNEGDGDSPVAGLIEVGNTLYGTTIGDSQAGYGTVYASSLGAPATEQPIYYFQGLGDGAYPAAGLVNVNGTLYGTTQGAGGHGYGTVFKTAGYQATALYSFKGAVAGDGAYPVASLINIGSALYGTTQYGGAYGYGTVFRVTAAGTEEVLYSFKGAAAGDGAYPVASLINVGGTLYGTTQQGGASGYGTVFAVKP